MDIATLLISLISGIVGGNVAGAAMPDKSLGTLGNSLSGLLGGGIGGSILQSLGLLAAQAATTGATGTGGFDIGSILANIAGSGVGGAVLMIVVSILKGLVNKNK